MTEIPYSEMESAGTAERWVMKKSNQLSSISDVGLKLGLFAVSYALGVLVTLGCAKQDSSFSLLGASQNFKQSDATVNNQIDILWVIDNSPSMHTVFNDLNVRFVLIITICRH